MKTTASPAYRKAGVDIDTGNLLVQKIRPVLESTYRPEVVSGVGGFASLCALPSGYREPLLVAGSDGVGSKLQLALAQGQLQGIGIDLVAMCVNDVICCGAEPLFFLDYYASAKIRLETAAELIGGIAVACREAGCSLIGGESAEMPGLYAGEDFDLAGFCIGVVERSECLGRDKSMPGDVLLALPSSGAHANGYSLIRHILAEDQALLRSRLPDSGQLLSEALLCPTRIYASILGELREHAVPGLHAVAHITGGGLTENLPRILQPGLLAEIDSTAWELPPLFAWLQHKAAIDDMEMRRVFNCGIGMVLCVAAEHSREILNVLSEYGESAWVLGRVGEHVQKNAPATVNYV